MKEKIVDFFKGICIGIANVIPGFSGGTMAVILNIYEKVIYAFSNILRHPIQVLKKLWTLLVGVIIGIIISIFVIAKLLVMFPLPTILFFIGLVIGSIPGVWNNAKKNAKIAFKDIVALVIAVVVMVILPLINNTNSFSGDISFFVLITVFLMGIISAAAMVIPGVSGSLVLMAFGYYIYLVTNIKDLLAGILSFDLSNLGNTFLIVVIFLVGCVLGVIYFAKLINILLEKHYKTVYYAILGLLIASPFAIVWMNYDILTINMKLLDVIIALFFLVAGVLSVIFSSRVNKKDE